MNIGIIGAGFTGLAVAFYLQKKGHKVTIIESDNAPGGLAIGFKLPYWQWSLEKHYHHWFTNDYSVLNLAREIGYKVLISHPKTSVFVDDKSYQLDSPRAVLTFPKLSIIDRLRMAAVLGSLRFDPYWKVLENIHATTFLEKTMGEKAYKMLWEPQLANKFGKYVNEVSLAWFWARIKKRTPSLAYPEGGFLEFAEHLVKVIRNNGGEILFNTSVTKIESIKDRVIIFSTFNSQFSTLNFDVVIVTLPSFLFLKISPQLPESYKKKLVKLKGLGAVNLVLRLKKQFMTDNTYWLSVCDKNSPIMAVVEHTNFMDKKYYNNEHIVYLGNYVETTHPYFSMNEQEILKIFDPFLKQINPTYQLSLLTSHLFKALFAQPIIPVNYSRLLPPFETPLPNVFLANIEQVYPWDRGTNYAVELGMKVAKLIE